MAEKTCCECDYWAGRCIKGRKYKVASDQACELFKPKNGKFEPMVCDFLRHMI